MGGLVVPALPLSQSAVYTYALRAIAQLIACCTDYMRQTRRATTAAALWRCDESGKSGHGLGAGTRARRVLCSMT